MYAMQVTIVLLSFAIGSFLVVAAFFANRRTGGEPWATPLNYTPLAQYLFFGGIGINLLGVAIAKIFLAPFP
jgi:hypothetical protein